MFKFFVSIVFLCGSLCSSISKVSDNCLPFDLKVVVGLSNYGKNLMFDCNLNENIQGRQYAKCINGVWEMSECFGKIAFLS